MIPGARTEIVALFALFACGALCCAQTAPSINTIDPTSALAGGPGFTMTVTGLNFTSVTVLFWNNSPLTPSIVSAAQLTVSVPAALIASAGSVNISVGNAAGVRSNVAVFTIARTAISIAPANLPAGIVGAPYSQTFVASGGTSPYRWGFAGTLPAGLTLNPNTGMLSGTPDSRGTFEFSVLVTDFSGAPGVRTFAFAVNLLPLNISTESPIFSGSVGLFYSHVFQASGGTPPYRWTVTAGQPPEGLKFDPGTGALTGTPSMAGAFNLTVQVTDSEGVRVSKPFQMTVEPPRLTITTSALPNALVGVPYAQQISAVGGSAPYTWSWGESVGWLALNAASGILTGTPSVPGSVSFTVQVKDSAGATSVKVFTLSVTPAQLTITSSTTLPDGILGAQYSQTISARGGIPPYSWSANGLPDGLNLDSGTGTISGSLQAGGALVFTVRVTDSVRTSTVDLFRINVALPRAPDPVITGLSETVEAADQPSIGLSIRSPYPIPLTGRLTLTFNPEIGAGDSTVQFITGGRVVDFNIPAGGTEAVFPIDRLAIQTGTVAGTIILAAQFSTSGIDITPHPQSSWTARLGRRAPVITAAKLVRSGNEIHIEITGFSTAREVTQAVFSFKAVGAVISQTQVTVSVDSLFAKWYQDTASVRYGSQFTLTQPFTVQGDPNAVIAESVTLMNRIGSTTALIK